MTQTQTAVIETQAKLIGQFSTILNADGVRIRVTLLVKPGECAVIRCAMRDANWKPVAGTKVTFRPEEWLHEYYEPMTQAEADRAEADRAEAKRRENCWRRRQ